MAKRAKVIVTQAPAPPAPAPRTPGEIIAELEAMLEQYLAMEVGRLTKAIQSHCDKYGAIMDLLDTRDHTDIRRATINMEGPASDGERDFMSAGRIHVILSLLNNLRGDGDGNPVELVDRLIDHNLNGALKDGRRPLGSGNPFSRAVVACSGNGRSDAYEELDQILRSARTALSLAEKTD